MRKSQTRSRFRPGTSGGCEAMLFEFRDWPRLADGTDASDSLGLRPIFIAAAEFKEAFAYLLKKRPDYRIESVKAVGLIELVSGSPLD